MPDTKRILFVDDDPDFRAKHVPELRKMGFTVTEAEGEEQAMEITAKKEFDLAVIDLMMENTDSGFTLCHHLKEESAGMPIILVSAANGEMGMEFTLDSPSERSWIKADVLINKPLRSEQLCFEINRLLGCTAAH